MAKLIWSRPRQKWYNHENGKIDIIMKMAKLIELWK